MARSRRAGGFHSSGSSSSSHAAAPPRPAPAASSTHNTHQQTPPHQPQVTNVFVQRAPPMMGGGGGTGIMGTMAAVAGGSVLGHGISNMIWGRENAPTQPAQAQQVAEQYKGDACEPQITSYSKCLEANSGSADNCKWAWDYFLQCQRKEHPEQSA